MKVQKDFTIADVVTDHVVIYFRAKQFREQSEVGRAIAEILEAIEDRKFRVLVLNFSGVRLLSSSFLGKMVMLHKLIAEQKAELRACCMGPEAYEGFRICKLQKLIPVFKTEDEAVA